ncbi:radical SAM/SPASM domain-containing protein [Haliangium sp.]|uniref:radical SAM/SPASM domain-containing protein n=1 Tax=Haliangium sp. TaxID=2663208 RepID=UPI003D0B7D7D
MKMHRGAADLLAASARRQNRPVTVTFQVTDRCNYECVHCYQTHDGADAGRAEELSLAEIERILDELAELGVLFLTLMGGEFFVRRDADDILRAAHERGFALKLLTTGHHVHERRADLIASLRPIQVDMSMYAARASVHDRVTRQEGSWQRTYAAARRLIERRVPVLLKAPVMEANVAELGELAELARSLGAESSFDAKITGKEDRDQAPVGLRMRETTLRAFYNDHDSGMPGFLAKSYADFDPAADDLRPLEHTPCRAGQQAASIDPRGEVWPCNALPLPCGNLREQSFAEVWYGSAALDEVRYLRWASIAECNQCGLRAYCQRCHGMALLEQGELRGPSLEACRHAVAVRDALRAQSLIPATETALPPTWDRVDPDGQHPTPPQHRARVCSASSPSPAGVATGAPRARRSAALRVLS